MKMFTGRTFGVEGPRLGPGVYADYEFDGCTFSYVPFVSPRRPDDRAVVRNVRLTNCEVQEPQLGSIVVEDCTVENPRTHGSFWVYGAVFKHVVLRGRFGSLIFTEFLPGGGDENRLRRKAAFAQADEAYYDNVDWALDIREAQFYECEIRYVPGHLVRRDPETQGLVWRDKLLQHNWKSPHFPLSGWGVDPDRFVRDGLPSVVLVAGKRHPRFKRQLQELRQLREMGVVEPD